MAVPLPPDAPARYDRNLPRYTSYPTAVMFHTGVDPDEYRRRLATAAEKTAEPLSLYVHLPFCAHRCTFCACNVVVTHNAALTSAYIDRLVDEIHAVASALGGRRTLAQYHWGGGTPTFHSVQALALLQEAVDSHFVRTPDAEASVEIDPRVTTQGHLEALRNWGFNRVSVGVQDTDPRVQYAIGRHQTYAQTRNAMAAVRQAGFTSVNLDLIYGLPEQTLTTFARTLDDILAIAPDRLALYGFAHVPALHRQQRRMAASTLPRRDDRLAMLALATGRLTHAGYVHIGMDHFALPGDELVLAREEGRLDRTFMGYTVRRASDRIGVGMTAIGDVAGAYLQNHKSLHDYLAAVDAGKLPVERGYVRTPDDELRGRVITEIMCNLVVRWRDVGTDAGAFETELDVLAGDRDLRRLVTIEADGVTLTELGTFFPRNVASVFDAYLPGTSGGFSKAV